MDLFDFHTAVVGCFGQEITTKPSHICLSRVALVDAGLTQLQALETATRKPAQFLGKLDSLGTIERGKSTDLVLLEANPLDDIHNTRRVSTVIVQGRRITPHGRQRPRKLLDSGIPLSPAQ